VPLVLGTSPCAPLARLILLLILMVDETVMLLWSPKVKRMITVSDVLRCLPSGMGEHDKIATMDAPSP